jgi:hypothetical protein
MSRACLNDRFAAVVVQAVEQGVDGGINCLVAPLVPLGRPAPPRWFSCWHESKGAVERPIRRRRRRRRARRMPRRFPQKAVRHRSITSKRCGRRRRAVHHWARDGRGRKAVERESATPPFVHFLFAPPHSSRNDLCSAPAVLRRPQRNT